MLIWLSAALAATIPVQGTLSGADGAPLNGSVEVEVRLSATGAPTSPAWSDTFTVSVADGAFAVALGSGDPLDPALFRQYSDWTMTVVVDGVESAPAPIGHVPLAAHAENAANLGGQPASAYARFGGPAWNWAQITWANAPSWLTGGYIGGTGVAVSGNTISSTLTGGTGITISGGTVSTNLTGGTGISVSGNTIATNPAAGPGISVSGNTISANLTGGNGISVSGGTISSALTAGPGISISGGAVSTNLTGGTGISVSGGTIATNLTAGPGITISGATISSALGAGTGLALSGTNLVVDAAALRALTPGSGATSATAGLSCKTINEQGLAEGNKLYWIKPAGTPFQAWCDMSTYGGGWTLVYRGRVAGSELRTAAAVGTLTAPDQGTHAKLSDAVIDLLETEWIRYGANARPAKDVYMPIRKRIDSAPHFSGRLNSNNTGHFAGTSTWNPASGQLDGLSHQAYTSRNECIGYWGGTPAGQTGVWGHYCAGWDGCQFWENTWADNTAGYCTQGYIYVR